jgi:hypothetical protein
MAVSDDGFIVDRSVGVWLTFIYHLAMNRQCISGILGH